MTDEYEDLKNYIGVSETDEDVVVASTIAKLLADELQRIGIVYHRVVVAAIQARLRVAVLRFERLAVAHAAEKEGQSAAAVAEDEFHAGIFQQMT